MLLKHDTATFIVEETAKLIEQRLYLTDLNGMVVAGSDGRYLNTIFPGANTAISNSRAIVLDHNIPPYLRGVAFPLYLQEKCFGCAVAIGNQEFSPAYLNLLEFTLETLAEKNQASSQSEYKRRMIEGWVTNLFDEEFFDWSDLESTAQSLGIKTTAPSQIALIKVFTNRNSPGKVSMRDPSFIENFILQNVINLVKVNYYCYLGRNLYAFSISPGVLSATHNPTLSEVYKAFSILNTKFEQMNMNCLIGIGGIGSTLPSIRKSFLQARRSVELSQRLGISEPMYIFDWGILDFLSQMPKDTVLSFVQQYFSQASELKEELCDTVTAYFANNCAVKKTADSLCIHKNTLLYRFHRIKELVGLDPQDFQDAVILYLWFQLRDLYPELLEEKKEES